MITRGDTIVSFVGGLSDIIFHSASGSSQQLTVPERVGHVFL